MHTLLHAYIYMYDTCISQDICPTKGYMYTYVHMYVSKDICIYTYMHVTEYLPRESARESKRGDIYMCVCMCVCVYIYIYIYIYIMKIRSMSCT